MPLLATENSTKTDNKKPEKVTSVTPDDKNNKTDLPSTSQAESPQRPTRTEPDYLKYPDSTGAYIYFNTLRPSQKETVWAPQLVSISNTDVPAYSSNDDVYPRVPLSTETRFIPMYTETLEDDELPVDPRGAPPPPPDDGNMMQSPVIEVEIIREEDTQPDEMAAENTHAEEDNPPHAEIVDELEGAIASITDDDVAHLNGIIEDYLEELDEPETSTLDMPDESFLDLLLRDD